MRSFSGMARNKKKNISVSLKLSPDSVLHPCWRKVLVCVWVGGCGRLGARHSVSGFNPHSRVTVCFQNTVMPASQIPPAGVLPGGSSSPTPPKRCNIPSENSGSLRALPPSHGPPSPLCSFHKSC